MTFSAPVEINGKRGNVAVVVKLTKDYFKALRILTPEGKIYSLSGYEKTELTPMQRTQKNDTQSASISSDDITIPRPTTEVKSKNSAREREQERDTRQAEIYQEIQMLKQKKKEALNSNEAYAVATKQRENAKTFSERIAASKALKEATVKAGADLIDRQIETLYAEADKLRQEERAEHEADRAKYSGAKTRGYSEYADTRTAELDGAYDDAMRSGDTKKMQELVAEAAERTMPKTVCQDTLSPSVPLCLL